jgi:3-hydroxyacyl-CoA dehydrogenase
VRPELIAPRKIIEAVRAGVDDSFAAGLVKEQQVFAECLETPATRNKIYLFFATRETGKLPHLAVPPAAVKKTAVVGMGTMGTGIVQALIAAGLPVVVRDENEAALQKGMARIGDSLHKRVAQGKLAPEQCEKTLALVSTTTNWSTLAEADVVIESVFEDVAAKRTVVARLEEVCPPNTIIATNTSTISLDALAADMARPERLVGMHFFNPAHRMPLLEVIRRDATDDAVVAAIVQLAKRLRKTPVLVRNREGFLVNRLFVPYLKEAFWLLQEGVEPEAIDRAMTDFGFAMGPLQLIDMAGLDILAFSDRVLRAAFPRHGPLPAVAARLVERGLLGQKSGAGVYSYTPGDYTPRFSDATRQIVEEVRVPVPSGAAASDRDEITDRLVLRMVCEAFWVVEEGIAQRESDLDVAMVLGTGFPDFRGGPLRYAGDCGKQQVLRRLEELAGKFGERFFFGNKPGVR